MARAFGQRGDVLAGIAQGAQRAAIIQPDRIVESAAPTSAIVTH